MAGRIKHKQRSRKTFNRNLIGKDRFYRKTQINTQKLFVSHIAEFLKGLGK